jgi:hypothetical protein
MHPQTEIDVSESADVEVAECVPENPPIKRVPAPPAGVPVLFHPASQMTPMRMNPPMSEHQLVFSRPQELAIPSTSELGALFSRSALMGDMEKDEILSLAILVSSGATMLLALALLFFMRQFMMMHPRGF